MRNDNDNEKWEIRNDNENEKWEMKNEKRETRNANKVMN